MDEKERIYRYQHSTAYAVNMQFSVWMIWNGNTTLYKGNTGASITGQPATHLIVHFAGECHHTNWKPM